MKTPRDILLTRHLFANPKLDACRTKALSTAFSKVPSMAHHAHRKSHLPVRVALSAWRELIWPCRRAWAGMGAVWVLMWAVNWGLSDRHGASLNVPSTSASALLEALEEQRRMLTELI